MLVFGNVSQKDKNNLKRIVNISSKTTGFKQSTLRALYEKQVQRKTNKKLTFNDNAHILRNEYLYLCPRPEGSEPSPVKQIGSVIRLFQCLCDFSTVNTSDVSVNTSVIMCVCVVL